MNYFNFIGKIYAMKERDKFKPIERRDFDSGWTNTTVRFNVVSGTNRVMVQTQGGKWQNDKKNSVKTLSKTVTDANGVVTKGETIEIPWAQRFDKDQIDRVAGFRKFKVDTGDVAMRYKLTDAVAAFENGTITDEMIEEIGIDNLEDAKTALTKSNAKKKEFISEYDFAEYMIKVVQSDKFKNDLFAVSGTYDVNYNAERGRFYVSYHVNKVVRVAEGTEPKTELKLNFYFAENAFNDSVYEETGVAHLNGWTDYRDGNLKSNGFMDMQIAMRGLDEKKLNRIKTKFGEVEGDAVKVVGINAAVIDGSERVELTVDMMDDEEREDYECGLLDFDEWKRSKGGNAYGDRISEIRFVDFVGGKSKFEPTLYTVDDMKPARAKEEKTTEKVFDIFADSLDDDDL